MDLQEIFGNTYITAKVLEEKGYLRHELIISSITINEIDGNDKPCILFVDVPEILVLNKTNYLIISEVLGSETDNWANSKLVLNIEKTMYENKLTPAVRVKKVIKVE